MGTLECSLMMLKEPIVEYMQASPSWLDMTSLRTWITSLMETLLLTSREAMVNGHLKHWDITQREHKNLRILNQSSMKLCTTTCKELKFLLLKIQDKQNMQNKL